ncbi:MAG: ABC1 kinase family protein [Clostridiaceae bacterium]
MGNKVKRFREIVHILTHYGFGYIVDSKINKNSNSPVNLRKAFEELGPTFIKIGQILSTRPDILPYSYIYELSKLQDNVPHENFNTINNIFHNEFLNYIDECFLDFEEKPVASASIAQVHRATLLSGEKVIVKIQRPLIYEKMHTDIYILKKLLNLTKFKFTDALIDPKEALDEILLTTEKELDFNYEVENMKKFFKLNKNVAFLTCPEICKEFCSSKIITMEEIQGIKIDNKNLLITNGYDIDDIGRKLALGYFKQIFTDGFFHGDPHPGNLLIQEGKICYLDFGIVGNLSDSLKESLNEIILSIVYNDINKLISVLMAIGIKKGFVDRNKLYDDLDYLFASYLSTSIQNIKISSIMEDILDAAKNNNISLPKDFTILIRGLVIIEGVIVNLSPDLKILDVAIPFVKSKNKFRFLDDLNLDDFIIRSYKFTKDSALLPGKIIELSEGLLNGRAKIKLNFDNINKPISEINKMVNRLVFSLIISAMIVGSSLILNSNIGPKMYNISIIGITGFLFAGILGIWLLISILKSGKM